MVSTQVSPSPALRVLGLSKSFSGVRVLEHIDLSIYPGQILALLGENGAGKSTLIKIIGGIHRPDEGAIEYLGKATDFRTARQAQDVGINTIHQELNIIPNRTVAQNIFLGREPSLKWLPSFAGTVDVRQINSAAIKYLKQVGVGSLSPVKKCGLLSTAQQQLVEIARAVSTESKLILMDEPTSSLSVAQVQFLFQLMRRLKRDGLGIVLTTHRLDEAFEVADRIVVLRDGKLVADKLTHETNPQEVIQWMVGRPVNQLFPKRSTRPQDVILEARGISAGKVIDVTFSIRRGEVFGLSGLMGSGRTEVARLLFGADRLEKGEILLNGKQVTIQSPEEAVKLGIGFVPEDRKLQALFLDIAVRQNMVLASLRNLSPNGIVRNAWVDKRVQNFIQDLNIRLRSRLQKVRYLSGGNQQKVVLSRWLMLSPQVLILDEPTRGIDVGAKAEVYFLINRLATEGIAILMISSELPELLGLCDRIGVMAEGKLAVILNEDNATPEVVMKYASMSGVVSTRSAQ